MLRKGGKFSSFSLFQSGFRPLTALLENTGFGRLKNIVNLLQVNSFLFKNLCFFYNFNIFLGT